MTKSNYGKNPMISVIITFYNIAQYAKKCMESLVKQDYMDCEFVCVDDGSTDNTLEVLTEFMNRDPRVKVFHKENGGLSDARNFGLRNAKGDYITIIDGDDFVHPHYLSILINAIESKKDRIVISPLRVTKYNESLDVKYGWDEKTSTYTINQKQVFEKILYDELSVSACAKLIPKEAYDNFEFPFGKVSEEVATIGQTILKFEIFVIVDQPLYAYVMRPDSIGHKKKVSYKAITDRIEALKILSDCIEQKYDTNYQSDLGKAIQYRWGWRYVSMAAMYDNVYDNKETIEIIKMEVHNWFRENIGMIIRNNRAPMPQRIRMLLYTYFPKTYNLFYNAYQKMKFSL